MNMTRLLQGTRPLGSQKPMDQCVQTYCLRNNFIKYKFMNFSIFTKNEQLF